MSIRRRRDIPRDDRPRACAAGVRSLVLAVMVLAGGERVAGAAPAAGQSPAIVSFTQVYTSLPSFIGKVAWGDYDNDGDLDVALKGATSPSTTIARVYRNDGGSVFTDIGAALMALSGGPLAWGDYDNDGDLDLLLGGSTTVPSDYRSLVYRNDGGVFVDIGAGLEGVNGAAIWGDYDNDGDLDILLSGSSTTLGAVTLLYRNDGGGQFTMISTGLPGVSYSLLAWGDYDSDGDLDLLLAGSIVGADIARVYRNDGGGTFVDIDAGLTGVWNGASGDWGDYDSDGDLDILIGGSTQHAMQQEPIARIYRNDGGGVFVDINAGLTGLYSCSLSWGDCDSDGDLDVLFLGSDANKVRLARVYRNDGGAFVDVNAGLTGVYVCSAAWGDYDNDGDLDILYSGDSGTTGMPVYVTRLYRSIGAPANTPPAAPGGLAAQVVGDQVTLSWAAATDGQTPSAGLSYNLRVGTSPGGTEIAPAMASTATGYRRVVRLGNAQQRTSWTLKLPPGGIYWSVQAVDGAFAGSPFAAEQSLHVIAFSRADAVLPGVKYSSLAWGDYDRDGDLDLLLTGTTDNGATCLSRIYRNDGAGGLAAIGAGLSGVSKGSAVWGDCDNDGDLDILLAGDPTGTGTAPLARVYRNVGSGVFVDAGVGLPGVYESAAAWGDYDNDGDLDLALAGRTGVGTYLSRVYRNDGGTFADVGAGLPGAHVGAVAWVDYDNDGDLDLLLAGGTGSGFLSRLYRNDGAGGFANSGVALPGVELCSAAWGDYDADGDQDLLLAGYTNASPWYIARVFRNDGGGVFAEVGAGLPGVDGGAAAWGDYDNDGDLDILLTGYTGFERLAQVYQNQGGSVFTLAGDVGDAVREAAVWGDYDNDGDLDIAMAGETRTGEYVARVYRSDGAPADTPPSAPAGLSAQVNGDEVTLSWLPSSDAQTSAAGLTYNLRIGSTPGGTDVVPAMAIAGSGYRQVVRAGNAQQRTTWTVRLPYSGGYYWSVQAVDGAWAGSPFAGEQTFASTTDAAEKAPAWSSLALAGSNPVVGEAVFRLVLPATEHVDLVIYDVAGRQVAKLVDGELPAGGHDVLWQGRGPAPASGVYLARCSIGRQVITQRFVIFR